jgi:hypothetical protein
LPALDFLENQWHIAALYYYFFISLGDTNPMLGPKTDLVHTETFFSADNNGLDLFSYLTHPIPKANDRPN